MDSSSEANCNHVDSRLSRPTYVWCFTCFACARGRNRLLNFFGFHHTTVKRQGFCRPPICRSWWRLGTPSRRVWQNDGRGAQSEGDHCCARRSGVSSSWRRAPARQASPYRPTWEPVMGLEPWIARGREMQGHTAGGLQPARDGLGSHVRDHYGHRGRSFAALRELTREGDGTTTLRRNGEGPLHSAVRPGAVRLQSAVDIAAQYRGARPRGGRCVETPGAPWPGPTGVLPAGVSVELTG